MSLQSFCDDQASRKVMNALVTQPKTKYPRIIECLAVFALLLAPIGTISADMSSVATTIQKAFLAEKERELDNALIKAKIELTIEHTIDDTAEMERQSFHTWAEVSDWLESKKIQKDVPGFPDLPQRGESKLEGCGNGVCTYDATGILHNHIYIEKVWYVEAENQLFITKIHLLDGD